MVSPPPAFFSAAVNSAAFETEIVFAIFMLSYYQIFLDLSGSENCQLFVESLEKFDSLKVLLINSIFLNIKLKKIFITAV